MLDNSQDEIDRQTIKAFEDLWTTKVIDGTRTVVTESVKQAIQNLEATYKTATEQQAEAQERIDAELEQLSRLRNAMENLLKESEEAAKAKIGLSADVNDITERVDGLKSNLDAVSEQLAQDKEWRARLSRWQESQDGRANLRVLGKMLAAAEAKGKAQVARDNVDEPGLEASLGPEQSEEEVGVEVELDTQPSTVWTRLLSVESLGLALVTLVAGVLIGLLVLANVRIEEVLPEIFQRMPNFGNHMWGAE